MDNVFLFLCMVFLHIVDDYYLQGCLATLKQKKWWNEHEPSRMYRNDFIVALLMHSMSWTFMIMLPIAACLGFNVGIQFFIAFCANTVVHGVTDHLKANMRKINLIQDQSIHLLQILITFLIFA